MTGTERTEDARGTLLDTSDGSSASLKVHVFQHVAFEDIGSMRPWLESHGATIGYTRFFAGESIPTLDRLDLLIVMGGPMSVNDEARFPWLAQEKEALRAAIARETPVLGICLGAQLIANALGARVYPNAANEIGWFPVTRVDGPPAPFRFPPTCLAFHWHGETFDLPPGALRLAESAACAHQAFLLPPRVLGLQFHLETTSESARDLVRHCADDLVPGPWVESADALCAAPADRYRAAAAILEDVLVFLTSRPAPPTGQHR